MKITIVITRFLLGLIFLVFGLNGFLHFIPSPPPSGIAGQFAGALFASNYLVVVFLLQIVSAILLLLNRYVTLLAPIIVNILLFHILMAPSGLPLAIVVTVLWIVVFLSVRSAFAGLVQQRVAAGSLR